MLWFMGVRHFPRLGCLATVANLVTSAMLLHLLHNVLQMAAPRVTIWLPPCNQGQRLCGRHACMPHPNFP